LLRVVLPAGLVVAFVAIVVAGVVEGGRADAPSPDGSPGPGEEISGPRIGVDHWHVIYEYVVCGETQPAAPMWSGSGVHTHGDGIMHIHPFTADEEGAGASLVKWFEYGGGVLGSDRVRLPGSPDTYTNGGECPDGTIGTVQVIVNGALETDYEEYIPQDGDRIEIVFGPEREFVRQALTDAPARLY